ncbi:MAG: LPS-assembly protein LptD, partial [Selenomonas artemidis]|nr:LPS-assembly protein LptD [Selenomonas artemidis]
RTHEGTMAEANGKVGAYYMTGKRFEFYPDKIIVYDGTQTKCSAKKPDYHLSSDVAEIYPGNRMVLTNVKFWLKNKVIFTKKRHEVDASKPIQRNFPRAGYDSDDGLWLEQTFEQEVAPRVTAAAHLQVTTQNGWRSHYDLGWENRGASALLTYGNFEDGDNEWIKKEPSLILGYAQRLGKMPISYNLYSEYGRWYGSGIHSNHWKYGISLVHDTIPFHGFGLDLAAGYSVTRESYDHSRVQGVNASAFLTKEFNKRFAAYVGGIYTKSTKQNALFSFDQEDYSKVLQAGFSYRIDERNRIAVGTKYAVEPHEWT